MTKPAVTLLKIHNIAMANMLRINQLPSGRWCLAVNDRIFIDRSLVDVVNTAYAELRPNKSK